MTGLLRRVSAICSFSCTQSSPAHQNNAWHSHPSRIGRRKRGSPRVPFGGERALQCLGQRIWIGRWHEKPFTPSSNFRHATNARRYNRQPTGHRFERDIGRPSFKLGRQSTSEAFIHNGISSCGRAPTHRPAAIFAGPLPTKDYIDVWQLFGSARQHGWTFYW